VVTRKFTIQPAVREVILTVIQALSRAVLEHYQKSSAAVNSACVHEMS